jgi:23S rRNA pseudouridine2605 synthase
MSERRIGLARALSKLGYCSRSRACELIRGGKVRVNGRIRRDPEAPVSESRDEISVDSVAIRGTDKIYLMLNKPRGMVTTAADEKRRETVYSLLPPELPWVAPVGRLDKASEGLLLLTNDSEWAARITDPDSHVGKTYHVQVGTTSERISIDQIIAGVECDGELLRVKRASILRGGEKNTWLEIVLDEGRNRQIRRIFESLAIEVLRLVRVRIGPVALGELAKGKSRRLTRAEKSSLG